MPFTIMKLETGISCPVNPDHKEGVYSLIYIKKDFQFYLCCFCSTLFTYNKIFGYVPLIENPAKRKIQTVTEEGAKRLLKKSESKKRILSGSKVKDKCTVCRHKDHFPTLCVVFIYKTINGKRKQVKCNCKG